MVSAEDLKRGNFINIMVTIILSGLGLYLALILAEAIRATIEWMLPDQDNVVAAAWIIFAVSLIVISLIVILLIWLYDGNGK